MPTKQGPISARELQGQLTADPAYRAMRAAKDKEVADLAEQRRLEQKPLLKDLARTGIEVDCIASLSNFSLNERIDAILLDHLMRHYSPWLQERIGRAFGSKPARLVLWDTLVALLQDHALEQGAADGVMAAISQIAKPSDLPTLIELVTDPSLGARRVFLVSNLMRSKKPQARATLLRLQHDPDLSGEIRARLARSRV